MITNYCTLFNSNYLSRGIAMYHSLSRNSKNFHLYIFAFDDACARILTAMHLPDCTVISLDEFEDDALLQVKPTRSAVEYCWTCTPSTILYVLDKFQKESCTYIDADLLFFSDPQVLIDEMGNDSVLITEHRFSKDYLSWETSSGKYCVQFMTFKNNPTARNALNWWREACMDSCELDSSNGKCGDQKYLDDWTSRFEGIHVLQHLGGGVAPWNVQQYEFSDDTGEIMGKSKTTGEIFRLIFFHFHGLKFYSNCIRMTGSVYALSDFVIHSIYFPYVQELKQRGRSIKRHFESYSPCQT